MNSLQVQESLKKLIIFYIILFIIGAILEIYLINKKVKYGFIIPILFSVYPLIRMIQIFTRPFKLYYAVIEISFLLFPVILLLILFLSKRVLWKIKGRKNLIS